jgi:hypothetical protein
VIPDRDEPVMNGSLACDQRSLGQGPWQIGASSASEVEDIVALSLFPKINSTFPTHYT